MNNSLKYLVCIVAVYAAWKLFYYFASSPSYGFNSVWNLWMLQLGVVYAKASVWVLNLFGVASLAKDASIYLVDSFKTVLVKEHCLAIPAMVIFTGSILFFPGNRLNKLWFIPLGLVGIALINLFRLVFVAIAFQYFPTSVFNFNHSVLYVILTYSLIFAMIVWWMNREKARGTFNS